MSLLGPMVAFDVVIVNVNEVLLEVALVEVDLGLAIDLLL